MAKKPSVPNRHEPSAPATEPLALQRARFALVEIDRVERLKREHSPIGNYRNFVQSLPATIIRNGLGQAMAMEKAGSGKDKGHVLLFGQMQHWLGTGWLKSPYRARPGDLMRAIVEGNRNDYDRAQAEAMAYLEWLKKFAVAALPEPAQAGTDEPQIAREG